MTDYQKYINALRKCADEHEKDKTSTGNIIVSDLCRDTAKLLESLEQEPILDKIRTEIIKNSIEDYKYHGCGTDELIIETSEVLKIIDHYKAESEE